MVDNIDNGTLDSPYREFDITLVPGEIYPLKYVYDYIRIIEASNPNYVVDYGGTSGNTTMKQGMGYRLPRPVKQAKITNTGNEVLNICVALGYGYIDDSRMSFTGGVDVQNTNETALITRDYKCKILRIREVEIITGGFVTIIPPGGNNTTAKKVLIQNKGSNNMQLFESYGPTIAPQGTFSLNFTESFNIYGTVGDKLSEVYFE